MSWADAEVNGSQRGHYSIREQAIVMSGRLECICRYTSQCAHLGERASGRVGRDLMHI